MKSSSLSVAFLVLVNLIPIFGAVFLGWDLFSMMMLYWMENVIIGFFNIIKMAFASKTSKPVIPSIAKKLFIIPFFCVHYGIFCLAHGVFIVGFFRSGGVFGNAFSSGSGQFPSPIELLYSAPIDSLGDIFGWALLSMVLSHGLSLVLNYFGQKEYLKVSVERQMFQPYQRIVILHVTILVGAFWAMTMGSPVVALILMAVLKTVVDVWAHLREHYKLQKRVLDTV